jgi:hypothetical protein
MKMNEVITMDGEPTPDGIGHDPRRQEEAKSAANTRALQVSGIRAPIDDQNHYVREKSQKFDPAEELKKTQAETGNRPRLQVDKIFQK